LRSSQATGDEVGLATDAWAAYSADPQLRQPPDPGSPGKQPPGEDLNLNIGWERFEKLLLAVSRSVLGLRGIRFRRYGTQGQEQHGIDLAGREADGRHTVIQCKDYLQFTAGNLRAAVEKFTTGRRPFNAYRLIVATSASAQPTQLADELAKLQDENPDLELDLWGSEKINEHLRYHGDVVAQFWTRETSEVFCTGAPRPGVPAPLPDRQEQAERILVGPLKTADVKPILREADSKRAGAPAESAVLYGDLAVRLQEAGHRGHAIVLRHRQLDALREAGLFDEAAELAALLAVTALYHGDRYEPRKLVSVLEQLARDAESASTKRAATTRRHTELVRAAVNNALHPLGAGNPSLLPAGSDENLGYWPMLVLILAEYRLATEPHQLEELDDLITVAITRADEQPIAGLGEDVAIRLRLVRAEYNTFERQELLRAARRHLVHGRHAALISAREARRCCLEDRAEEALESWRDAVQDAIHAGLAEDAADWLYAIRSLNIQYGPWSTELDDEHHLAQALRTTGTGRLLDRIRDPRAQAMSAVLRKKPIEAVVSARRWLTDSVVTGSWADENEALSFLGDLYRDNSESALAATYYQRAGNIKRLKELSANVGDLLLPVGQLRDGPWWVLRARAALISAQTDLIEDHSVGTLISDLTDLAARGRAGELTDSPTQALTLQATKSACTLVSRGTPEQAVTLLDLLASDVVREPNHYRHTDDEHAVACVEIALAHPDLTMTALTRLFDLAEHDAHKALELLASHRVLGLLGARSHRNDRLGEQGGPGLLTDDEQTVLRARAIQLAQQGGYLTDVVCSEIDPTHPSVRDRAEQARDRILNRPAPEPGHAELGTAMVTDSYLASSLADEDQEACLRKLLDVAGDPREVASTRQDALVGASNLVIEQSPDVKHETFQKSLAFVLGEQDGSHLDDELTGESHPLSSFRFNGGPASLCGHGLRLAAASATTIEEQEWVRDQALGFLRSEERSILQTAAKTLNQLPREITSNIDTTLLATHNHVGVRQLSAVLCMQNPERCLDTAMRLAGDSDGRVRRTLAEAAAYLAPDPPESAKAILEALAQDPRHGVRVATNLHT
jgi:hypothetical protein